MRGKHNRHSRRGLLTQEQKEWAYEKWCAGYTQYEIADALLVSQSTIGKALKTKKTKPILYYGPKERGTKCVQYTKGQGILTQEQIEWAYQKWCEGYTQTEIGEALYVDMITVQRRLRGRKKAKKPLVYDFTEEELNERHFTAD